MEFFVINKRPSNDVEPSFCRTDFTYDESVLKAGAPQCPECGAYVGMLQARPPFRVHLETWGNCYGDFAFWMSDFLVSEKVRNAYRDSRLTGLSEFVPTEVVSTTKHVCNKTDRPEYFRTIPSVGAARIDVSASGVRWRDSRRPSCHCCFGNGGPLEGWDRIVVDEDSWNGDDIFYAYGIPGALLATLRFKAWADKHEFKNLDWRNAEEYSHSYYSPGS